MKRSARYQMTVPTQNWFMTMLFGPVWRADFYDNFRDRSWQGMCFVRAKTEQEADEKANRIFDLHMNYADISCHAELTLLSKQ